MKLFNNQPFVDQEFGRQCGERLAIGHQVQSVRMDDYVRALRAQVCTHCREQDAAGVCALRKHGDCALDAYLSLVIDAIESVDADDATGAR